ncbi:LOW QUALITY PROTEIN: hypothetical protein CRUP_004130 [Coryphaenoides rupestris]|nr:LOW QUALITY PROTEIN: hypothetical protein CRUP_004130 [Coryphaenoides rupestris]
MAEVDLPPSRQEEEETATAAAVVGVRGPQPQPRPPPVPYEEYECKICYNYFDLDRRAPKLLECLHTFCEECLNTLHVREERPWRISCPVCRHRTPVPDYRIQNLPNNTKVTEDFPLYMDSDPLPQDALPLHPPPLHPALVALRRGGEEASAAASASVGAGSGSQATPSSTTTVSTATTLSQDSVRYNDSCQSCKRVALTTGCVWRRLLLPVHAGAALHGPHLRAQPQQPPVPGGAHLPVGILAMFSVVVTWLICWLKYRPDHDTGRASATNNSREKRLIRTQDLDQDLPLLFFLRQRGEQTGSLRSNSRVFSTGLLPD